MAHIRIETATTEHTSLHTFLYAPPEQQEIVPQRPQEPAEAGQITSIPTPEIVVQHPTPPLVGYAPDHRPAWIESEIIPDTLPSPSIDTAIDMIDDAPYIDAEGNLCEVCCITEARIDLKKSHAFLRAGALLHMLGEHFLPLHFTETEDGILFDVYANDCFVVTYCLNIHGKDQLRVRWIDPDAEEAHTEYELPDKARQIARLLGGGTNMRLVDSMVRCTRLPVPDVVV